MQQAAQNLLRPTVVRLTLSQDIHDLLRRTYTRPILQFLSDRTDGATEREIDVLAVGVKGSAKTTADTLERLRIGQLVERKGPKRHVRWHITEKGREALDYAKKGDTLFASEKKGRV